jgi:hypothetical protein
MNYLTPLQSNFRALDKCAIFHKERPARHKTGRNLPSPEENYLRMEIALLKARQARIPWIEARIAALTG